MRAQHVGMVDFFKRIHVRQQWPYMMIVLIPILLITFWRIGIYVYAERKIDLMLEKNRAHLNEIVCAEDARNGLVLGEIVSQIYIDHELTSQLYVFNSVASAFTRVGQVGSDEELYIAQTVLNQNQQFLKAINAEQNRGPVHYDFDLRDVYGAQLLHLNDIKNGAKLVYLQYLVNMHHDQKDAAVDNLLKIMQLADSLKNEASFESQRTRINLTDDYILDPLQKAVDGGLFSEEQKLVLCEGLKRFPLAYEEVVKDCLIAQQAGAAELPADLSFDDYKLYFDEYVERDQFATWQYMGVKHLDRCKVVAIHEILISEVCAGNTNLMKFNHLIEALPHSYLVSRELLFGISPVVRSMKTQEKNVAEMIDALSVRSSKLARFSREARTF
ncbi:hypothetical protein JD969_08620 [Planctomycetota bacterium]|nr:hypothetical protein JD969_08620 [Planctomycetota bacterium]